MITSLNITTKRWHVRDSKVKRSNKKRFELCLGCEVLLFLTIAQHPHVFEGLRFVPSASSIELRKEEDGEVMIRASQGHSMKVSRGKWQTQGCNPGYLWVPVMVSSDVYHVCVQNWDFGAGPRSHQDIRCPAPAPVLQQAPMATVRVVGCHRQCQVIDDDQLLTKVDTGNLPEHCVSLGGSGAAPGGAPSL